MGLKPEIWGSKAWHTIHSIALAFPENPSNSDKEQYNTFFKSLPDVLPCPICGEHLRENYKKLPINLESREKLYQWTVDLHNLVNEQTGKQAITIQQADREFIKNSKQPIPELYLLGIGFLVGIAFATIAVELARKRR